MANPANAETGKHLIQGMYPFVNMMTWREQNYLTKFSPLKNTAFENMISGFYYSTGDKVCVTSQV